MESSNPILHQDDHYSSVRRRNKILIISFFSLIILLALITGGFIVSLVQQINSKSLNSNRAIREFCSPFEIRPSCISLLSSEIKAPFNTNPNHILFLSLEASLKKLSKIISILPDGTRSEHAFGNCSSSLSHSAGRLSEILEILRVDPDVGTYEHGNMIAWIGAAVEDLSACEKILANAESAAADPVRMKVVEVRAFVAFSKDYLVNGNFGYFYGGETERSPWDEIVENLITVSLFGCQYFVLVLLFCLLLRLY